MLCTANPQNLRSARKDSSAVCRRRFRLRVSACSRDRTVPYAQVCGLPLCTANPQNLRSARKDSSAVCRRRFRLRVSACSRDRTVPYAQVCGLPLCTTNPQKSSQRTQGSLRNVPQALSPARFRLLAGPNGLVCSGLRLAALWGAGLRPCRLASARRVQPESRLRTMDSRRPERQAQACPIATVVTPLRAPPADSRL